MLISAGINGLGASILWVGQGKYITSCANEENKGFFFSLFWFILMTAFVGNLIGAFVIGQFSLVAFFVIMSLICLLGSLGFLLLAQPKSTWSALTEGDHEEVKVNE